MRFKELSIGAKASYYQTITAKDIEDFAKISGDNNPVHLNDEFASKTQFEKRIAHGFMLVSFFSAIFGTKLPGPGCVYLSQRVKFVKPVYIGDHVIAQVLLTKINQKSGRLTFKTTCTVNEEVVVSGEAEIYIHPKNFTTSEVI